MKNILAFMWKLKEVTSLKIHCDVVFLPSDNIIFWCNYLDLSFHFKVSNEIQQGDDSHKWNSEHFCLMV